MRSKLLRIRSAVEWNSRLKKSEYTERRLTFGMHAGVMIKDLPLEYIKWGIQKLETTWAEQFARELQRRDRSYK